MLTIETPPFWSGGEYIIGMIGPVVAFAPATNQPEKPVPRGKYPRRRRASQMGDVRSPYRWKTRRLQTALAHF